MIRVGAQQGEGQLTVQLLQGELLGLTDKAEDHHPCYKIQAGIEANCTHVLAESDATSGRDITNMLQQAS